jgi:hypothetical protein
MNLLIAPFTQGLLGAVFPTTGMPEIPKPQLDPAVRQRIINMLPPNVRNLPEPRLSQVIMQILRQQQRFKALQGGGVPFPNAVALPQQQQQQQQQQQSQQQQQQPPPPPPQHQQQQQSADHFPQNPGVNMPSTGPVFGNMGPKQGELNPFVPGSQANAIASGLLAQPTPLQQLQQRQHQQQQAHAQQQHQAQQNQRAMMEMQRVLSGGLGAGVGGGLGGGLMNTGGTNSLSGGLGPLGMGGSMGSTGVVGGSNALGVSGFRNGGGGGLGLGLGMPVSGAGFGGLSSGTGFDGGGASGNGDGGGGGLGGVGMPGMPHGAPGGVTPGMFQSFMQRNGGGQGQ